MSHDPDCLFCKIIAGTIPSKKLYEDDDCLAFNDIHPAAPIHFLMIPKKHISMLAEVTFADTELLGKMMGLLDLIALLMFHTLELDPLVLDP